MQNAQKITTREKWALFRFLIIARLIAFPPEKGEPKEKILHLSQMEWNYPVCGKSVKIAFSTIESRCYRAVEASENPNWSHKLHHNNIPPSQRIAQMNKIITEEIKIWT
jgi:hypothetical protein